MSTMIDEIKDRKPCYTEAEAAEILGVKESTLARYRREGKLKGNYALFGRNYLYTPAHIAKILEVFTVGRREKAA